MALPAYLILVVGRLKYMNLKKKVTKVFLDILTIKK
jgi:hypothetical protein